MFLDAIFSLLGRIFFFTGSIYSGSFPKPLSIEEEKECLRLVKLGDKKATDKLVSHNLRLVAHIAKKYNGSAELDDLLSVGSIGLIKAVNTYEEKKGTSLATYTARCIENEILMLLRSNKKHKNNLSLSDVVGLDKDGNELSLIDLLSDKDQSVFEKVESKLEGQKLVERIKEILTDREFKIICLRYGLKGGKCYAQREVASFLKISRSYISRIEKHAIEKLRQKIKLGEFF
ncbi:MAG: sigma-70 family RNA polymerase sigma factor [Clostridiales bacterium]|nr:sigma-70 family RNA polymerase sigma factor [Clostridiales bacterium]